MMIRSSVVLAALICGLTGVVAAQDGTAQGELGVEATPAVSAADQRAQAEAIQKRGGQLATRLSKMLDEARRDKDIMRANCINRKLTEVNANTRSVEQRAKALNDAINGGDEGRRNHEFTVLTVLSQKLDMLDQEASQCLGQSAFEPGASQVVTDIDEGTTSEDPTTSTAPPPAPPSVTVPPPNSPTN
jgi:hypothetical protein